MCSTYEEGLLHALLCHRYAGGTARLLNSRCSLDRGHVCDGKGELICWRLLLMLTVELSACQEPALRIKLDEWKGVAMERMYELGRRWCKRWRKRVGRVKVEDVAQEQQWSRLVSMLNDLFGDAAELGAWREVSTPQTD